MICDRGDCDLSRRKQNWKVVVRQIVSSNLVGGDIIIDKGSGLIFGLMTFPTWKHKLTP